MRVRYTGVTDPKARFAALKPYRDEVIRMQSQCRPFGPDYMILEAAKKALDTAAYHFTREPDFFALRPPRS